jgi:hypothetical protein
MRIACTRQALMQLACQLGFAFPSLCFLFAM